MQLLQFILNFSAEFIIDIADKNPTFDCFKKALIENGAEFSDSFMTNLLRIIQHMKPANNTTQKGKTSKEYSDPMASKFPGLAIPNEKPPTFSSDEESEEEEDDKKDKRLTAKDIFKDELKTKTNDAVVDQAMAELEALAPSQGSFTAPIKESLKKDVKKRERSRSPEHKDIGRRRDRSRDRVRDRKSRSREREKDRKSRRSRSRDRRSRSRDRRSRSRDRRSRSRDRRRRSKSRPTSSCHRSRDRHRRSRSKGRGSPLRRKTSPSKGRSSPSKRRSSPPRGRRSPSHEREHKYGDYGKKFRRKSPEVEMSDDPEPGKVSMELSLYIIK